MSWLLLCSSSALASEFKGDCPVSVVPEDTLQLSFGESTRWFGSESLATVLPADGKWSITQPGFRIAVKLFLWSAGFEPGMEKNLSVAISSVIGQEVDAVVKDVTNAQSMDGGVSSMLVGIDFPSAGCWRIAANYLGHPLTFVVETVDN